MKLLLYIYAFASTAMFALAQRDTSAPSNAPTKLKKPALSSAPSKLKNPAPSNAPSKSLVPSGSPSGAPSSKPTTPPLTKEVFTTFAYDWAQAGIMFDIMALKKLIINELDINTVYSAKDGKQEFYIYTKVGSYQGFERDESAWTLHEKLFITGAGLNKRTLVKLSNKLEVEAETTMGLYITFKESKRNAALRMTKSTAIGLKSGDQYTSNGDLVVYVGKGKRWKFNRNVNDMIPNVAIRYTFSDPNAITAAPCDYDYVTTTYASNDGSDGIMFDIKAKVNIYIFNFDIHTKLENKVEVAVYNKAGTFVGSENSNIDWIVSSVSEKQGAGSNAGTDIGRFNPVSIKKGDTHAWYITLVTSCTSCTDLRYTMATNKVTGDVYKENFDLQIMVGKGKRYLFKGGQDNKIFNGKLYYYTDFSSAVCPPSDPPNPSPSAKPSLQPSATPSKGPVDVPSAHPSRSPVDVPSSKPSLSNDCKAPPNGVGGYVWPLYNFAAGVNGAVTPAVCNDVKYTAVSSFAQKARTTVVLKYNNGDVNSWKTCLEGFQKLGSEVLMHVDSKFSTLYTSMAQFKQSVDAIYSLFTAGTHIDGIFIDHGTNLVDQASVSTELVAEGFTGSKEEIAKSYYSQAINYVLRRHNACKVVVNFQKPYYYTTMQEFFKDNRVVANLYDGTQADFTTDCRRDFGVGPFCKYAATTDMKNLYDNMKNETIWKQQNSVLVHASTGHGDQAAATATVDNIFNAVAGTNVNWFFVTEEADGGYDETDATTNPKNELKVAMATKISLIKASTVTGRRLAIAAKKPMEQQ